MVKSDSELKIHGLWALGDKVVSPGVGCQFMKTDAIPWSGLSLGALGKDCAWVLRRHMTVSYSLFMDENTEHGYIWLYMVIKLTGLTFDITD